MDRLKSAPISTRNKYGRLVWGIAWTLLFRPTPRPFHAWRCVLLRLFGAQIGSRVRMYPTARIWAPWNLTMGDDSCISAYVDCYHVAAVIVEDRAVVSQYTYLCTASHNYTIPENTLIVGSIKIKAGAWVTAHVFIAPGITVGDRAVVQARSVVLTGIPANVVAGGHPAKTLKYREKGRSDCNLSCPLVSF